MIISICGGSITPHAKPTAYIMPRKTIWRSVILFVFRSFVLLYITTLPNIRDCICACMVLFSRLLTSLITNFGESNTHILRHSPTNLKTLCRLHHHNIVLSRATRFVLIVVGNFFSGLVNTTAHMWYSVCITPYCAREYWNVVKRCVVCEYLFLHCGNSQTF